MATSKNEKALKARQTKLNNKSKEELINVVLKKDKTEKVLNRQISKLKGENYALEKDIEAKDIKLEIITNRNKTEIESYKNNINKLNKELNTLYNVLIGIGTVFIIFIILHLV